MPLYEYRCLRCQKIFEAVAQMDNTDASQQCTECLKEGVVAMGTKIISAPRIVSRLNVRISKKRRRIM